MKTNRFCLSGGSHFLITFYYIDCDLKKDIVEREKGAVENDQND